VFMQKLRKSMGIFLWVIAIIFVLFIFFDFGANVRRSGSMLQRGIIAKVGRRYVSYNLFSSEYQDAQQRAFGQRPEIDPRDQRKLSDQVLNQIIINQILSDVRQRLGITFPNNFYSRLAMLMPPQEFLRDTVFYTNGQFDLQKYQNIMKDPRMQQFFLSYQHRLQKVIPDQVLNFDLMNFVRVSGMEILREYIEDSLMVKIEYMYFPPEVDTTIKPTDEELKKYFEENIYKYNEYGALMSYAVFPVPVVGADKERAYENALNIISQFNAGVAFDTLAYIYSESPTGKKGGDAGEINITKLPVEMQKALRGVKVGGITRPIKMDEGVYVLYVESRKGNLYHLREIFIRYKPSYETYTSIKKKAEDFIKAYKEDPQGALKTYGVEMKDFLFNRFQQNPMGVNFGFLLKTAKEGEFLPPLLGNDGFYVFLMKKNMMEKLDFEVLKEKVRADYLLEKGIDMAYNRAMHARLRMKDKLAADGARYGSTGYFSMTMEVPGIPFRSSVYGAAFNLTPGRISQPIRDVNGVYIIRVKKRKDIDQNKIQSYYRNYMQIVFQIKRQEVMNELYSELVEKYRIQDYRSELSI